MLSPKQVENLAARYAALGIRGKGAALERGRILSELRNGAPEGWRALWAGALMLELMPDRVTRARLLRQLELCAGTRPDPGARSRVELAALQGRADRGRAS